MNKKVAVCKFSSLWLLAGFLTVSCGSRVEYSAGKLIKDDLGREVRVKKEIKRVMALSSSLTEMLYLVCEEDRIVGRTHNCNYPPQVLQKTVVSNYPIDYEKLLMLQPDLVVAKDGIISIEEALKIEGMGIPVYFQQYQRTEDIFLGIEKLGRILNREKRATEAADSLRKALKKEEESVQGFSKPSVLMIISKDKIFVYGKDSYASDMLDKAGGKNVLDSVYNQPYPSLTTEYILHLNPDIILGAEQVDLGSSFFAMYPELKMTGAYKSGRVYTVPEELISRPGPRVVEGIKLLKQQIHPDAQ